MKRFHKTWNLTFSSLVLVAASTSLTKAEEVTGYLLSVEKNLLILADPMQREWDFYLTGTTKITALGKEKNAADLHPRHLVRVLYREIGKKREAVEVMQGIAGVITQVPSEKELLWLGPENKTWTLHLEPASKVTMKGKEFPPSKLRPGLKAEIIIAEKDQQFVVQHLEVLLGVKKKENGGAKETKKEITAISKVEEERFTMVQIFYATDRNRVETQDEKKTPAWGVMGLFFPAFGIVGIILLLHGVHRFIKPGPWGRLLPYGWCLGGGAAITGIFFWSWYYPRQASELGDKGVFYGSERGSLDYGICQVSIPKAHKMGHLETPSILRLEFQEDPGKHVVLHKVEPQPAEQFFAELRKQAKEKEAFVFIHGFNVSFEEAARRTAQLANDLQFSGVPILYSWPSQGAFLQYTVDETNVEWTIPHLRTFLMDVAKRSGAKTVHLIGHSMGNRALTRALQGIGRDGEEPKIFKELVLTAPDIDADVFRNEIFPAIVGTVHRVTLYASNQDRALQVSKQVHGYPRLGETEDRIVILPPMETVDVSTVESSFFGHSYYGDNNSILADLFYLLQDGFSPDRRHGMESKFYKGQKYWVFLP